MKVLSWSVVLVFGILLVLGGCLGPGSTKRIPADQRRLVDVDTHMQSMQTAFERINQWTLESYNFPDEVIARAQPETGLLILKEFAVVQRASGELVSVGYTLRMDIRHQRIRYTFIIGDPNSVELTTENDAVMMERYFQYLRERISLAIERDDSF